MDIAERKLLEVLWGSNRWLRDWRWHGASWPMASKLQSKRGAIEAIAPDSARHLTSNTSETSWGRSLTEPRKLDLTSKHLSYQESTNRLQYTMRGTWPQTQVRHKKLLTKRWWKNKERMWGLWRIYVTLGTFSAHGVVCISQHRSTKLKQLVQLGLKMTKSAKNDRHEPTYQLTTIITITFNLLKAKL